MAPDELDEPQFETPAIAIAQRDGVARVLMVPNMGQEPRPFSVRQAHANTALRFAVGEPGRRGTVWRLWANKNHDDVYVASRKAASEFKVSLHESGDWRMQVIAPQQPKTVVFHDLRKATNARILDQWTRPPANQVGWTHALSIVLPSHHMAWIPDDNISWQDVRWIAAPAAGHQVDFEVHLVAPSKGLVSYSSLVRAGGSLAVMDALQLSGGEVAVVLAITSKTSDAEGGHIVTCEEVARAAVADPSAFDRAAHLGPRQMIFGPGPSGERRIYDLAFPQVE